MSSNLTYFGLNMPSKRSHSKSTIVGTLARPGAAWSPSSSPHVMRKAIPLLIIFPTLLYLVAHTDEHLLIPSLDFLVGLLKLLAPYFHQ